MRGIKTLSDRGIPTIGFFEMDSEEELTEDWQYIGVWSREEEEKDIKLIKAFEDKLKFVQEAQRIYGSSAIIYLCTIPTSSRKIILEVDRGRTIFGDQPPLPTELLGEVNKIAKDVSQIPDMNSYFGMEMIVDKEKSTVFVASIYTYEEATS